MIVRVMTEDQYRLNDGDVPRLQQLDDQLDSAMDRNDKAEFESTLQQLIEFVRQKGTVVEMSEVVSSDLIIPAPDMTLEEAHRRLHAVQVQPTGGE